MYGNNYLDLSDNNLSLSKSYNVSYADDNSQLDNNLASKLQCKVILIGDQAVGKTAIFHRFIENQFTENYKCTVGVEYKIKSLLLDNATKMEIKIWDTCGAEQFRSLTKQFFRESNGAILVFDLTNRTTFEHLNEWIKDLKNNAPEDCQIYVAGNKSDLEDQRQVLNAEIQDFIEDHSEVKYLECSAKTGTNVVLMFEDLASLIAKAMEKKMNEVEPAEKRVYKVDKKMSKLTHKQRKCC